MKPFCLWRSRTGALVYWKAKWGIDVYLVYDSPRIWGECKSRRFKIVCSFEKNKYTEIIKYTFLENYYYRKSKPKPKIMFAYYKNYNWKDVMKDYTYLQKFK